MNFYKSLIFFEGIYPFQISVTQLSVAFVTPTSQVRTTTFLVNPGDRKLNLHTSPMLRRLYYVP